MKNQYLYKRNLRTHYSPIRNNRQNLNHCKSYRTYIDDLFYDYNEYINTNPYNEEIIPPPHNKSHYKNVLYKSVNNPYLNYHYRKKYINLDNDEKEILAKSFNRINPFYFQDKIKSLEKERINEKIKDRIFLQRQALKQLSLNKINHPSEKEKLQKINELSNNPLLPYESGYPFDIKYLNNYNNEYLITKYNTNIYNKPRKEIEYYYNINQYKPPLNINIDPIIHTKPNFIFPNYDKNKKIKEKYKEDLDKQVMNNYINKRYQYIDELNDAKIRNKIYDDYEIFLKNKEKEEKLKKENEILQENIMLENYKQYENKYLKEREKDYLENIKKKMEDEEIRKIIEEKKEKSKNKKNVKDWYEINKEYKEIKKNDKDNEIILKNYSEDHLNKCKHGKELYKCLRCGKKYSRDQVHKVIC